MAIQLSDEMRGALDRALTDRSPVMVATASAKGVPDLAFKGSTMVWDSEHLAFWERSHGQVERNLAENPNVALLYRNAETRTSWKFVGVAELLRHGEAAVADLRERIMARTTPIELDRDPQRVGTAVLIRVDLVIQGRAVIMHREGVEVPAVD
jgi:hypothetical protein